MSFANVNAAILQGDNVTLAAQVRRPRPGFRRGARRCLDSNFGVRFARSSLPFSWWSFQHF